VPTVKHLETYLAHYAAVVAGTAATVASFKPAFLVTLLPFLGPHASAVIGGAAAIVALLHALGIDPAPAAKALLCAVLVGAALPGCALTPAQARAAAPFIEAAVDVAVATAEAQGLQAWQINAIAKLALVADQGASASLNAIAAVVNDQLAKLNLPAGDMAAARVLQDALKIAIETKLQADPAAAQFQAAAALVIRDVINATGG